MTHACNSLITEDKVIFNTRIWLRRFKLECEGSNWF